MSYHLGEGQREKNAARAKNGRRKILDFLQEYKQQRGCLDCGEDYPYWMLDFDHVRGTKRFSLGQSYQSGMNMQAVLEEVAKCEVVCANCHRNRTHMRSSGKYAKDVSVHYGVAAGAAE